jgi:hypothetical protein
MRKRRLCPWKDFAGNELREGDKIIHPSGESGLIKFDAKSNLKTDSWWVFYSNGDFSRLCLQIGDKGRAVKVK